MVKTKSKFKVVVTLSKSPQRFKTYQKRKKKNSGAYSVKYLDLTKLRGRVYRYLLKSLHFIFA